MTGTSDLQRFIACMDYQPADQRPNHELGVWGQTRARWEQEAPEAVKNFTWDWFTGEADLGIDHREFIDVNYSFVPPFQRKSKGKSKGTFYFLSEERGTFWFVKGGTDTQPN